MIMRDRFIGVWGVLLMVFAFALKGEATLDEDYEVAFDEVWQTVADTFWDENYGGLDWPAIREQYREQLESAKNDADWISCIEAMLAELGQSHFHLISTDLLQQEDGAVSGLTGAFLAYVDGRLLVRRVLAGSSAAKEGMKPGDEILSIGGDKVSDILEPLKEAPIEPGFMDYYQKMVLQSRLDNGAEKRVLVRGRTFSGESKEWCLKREADSRERSKPMGNMPPMPYEFEHTWMDDGILYLRLSMFVLEVNQEVRELLAEAQERGAPGVIFDLRDNPGGFAYLANSFAGMMVSEQQELGQMTMRNGFIKFIAYPQANRFECPVCILVDRYSASTSEIFAAGLQECGRVTVVGERSTGASLPSFFKKLATGHLLQYAIADYKTPMAYRIEGNGVIPDVEIRLSRESFSNSKDPAVAAAVEAILSPNQK